MQCYYELEPLHKTIMNMSKDINLALFLPEVNPSGSDHPPKSAIVDELQWDILKTKTDHALVLDTVPQPKLVMHAICHFVITGHMLIPTKMNNQRETCHSIVDSLVATFEPYSCSPSLEN